MTDSSALVSIAMATYNGEKYLSIQLDSLINQTYPNTEIVITDDCSTDNTIAIIKEYQIKYPFIRLFKKVVNTGVTKTFEDSVRESKGKFIALCDQDDIWELDKITILMKEMGAEDAIYSNSILVDADGELLNKDFNSVMKLRSYYSGVPFLLANCVPGHTILMKADFVKKILPFPKHIFFDKWISFCAAANNGIKYIDKGLVLYRQHASNTVGVGKTRNKTKQETANEIFENKLLELKTFQTAHIASEETKVILNRMVELFTKKWSLQRSFFFFKNIDTLLIIKNKPYYRKIFYCIKMIFKANY